MECLEGRQLLAGVVTVTTTGPNLFIQGDDSSNSVIVSSVAGQPQGTYQISSTDGTLVRLNGAAAGIPAATPLRIPGVVGGSVNVDLGLSDDTFTFNNSGNGANDSIVNQNLNIRNDGAGDKNILSNLTVTGTIHIDDVVAGAFNVPMPARPAGVTAAAPGAGNGTNTLTNVNVTNGGSIVVNNAGAKNTTTITGASTVQGGVWITEVPGATAGVATISGNSIITGPTVITHQGGGSSTTVSGISNVTAATPITAATATTRLMGVFVATPPQVTAQVAAGITAAPPTGVGLKVTNDLSPASGGGADSVKILGGVVVGQRTTTPLPAGSAPFSQLAVMINDLDGGSGTQFSVTPAIPAVGATAAVPAGNIGPVIQGGVSIQNGIPGSAGTGTDTLSINSTNVFGPTFVYNGNGTTNTTVINSFLGSSPGPGTLNGLGNPVVVINDSGADTLAMVNTSAPWGVFVNNDDAGGGNSNFIQQNSFTGGAGNANIPGAPNPSTIGTTPSNVGVLGASLTAALRAAFPSAYPAPAAAATGTFINGAKAIASSNFTANGTGGAAGTYVAPTLAGNGTSPNVTGQNGDTITWSAGAAAGNANNNDTINNVAVNGANATYTAAARGGAVAAVNNDTFTVLGPGTFAFQLPQANNTFPAVGDTLTFRSGANGPFVAIPAQSRVISAVNVSAVAGGNRTITMNFVTPFTNPVAANDAFDIARTSLNPTPINGVAVAATPAKSPTAVLGLQGFNTTGFAGPAAAAPFVAGQPGDTITWAAATATAALGGTTDVIASTPVLNTATQAIAYTTTANMAATPAAADTFTVLGPKTFSFTLPSGTPPPAVGDTVTIAGTSDRITAVSIQNGNTVVMNFANGFVGVGAGNPMSVTRTSVLPGGAGLPALPGLITNVGIRDALFVGGGGGNDTVNIGATLAAVNAPIPIGGGQININQGGGGNNFVTIQGQTPLVAPTVALPIGQILINGSSGVNSNDTVTLQNVAVTQSLVMNFNNGPGAGTTQTVNLLGATTVPSIAGSTFIINGSLLGFDVLNDPGNVLTPALLTGVTNSPG